MAQKTQSAIGMHASIARGTRRPATHGTTSHPLADHWKRRGDTGRGAPANILLTVSRIVAICPEVGPIATRSTSPDGAPTTTDFPTFDASAAHSEPMRRRLDSNTFPDRRTLNPPGSALPRA